MAHQRASSSQGQASYRNGCKKAVLAYFVCNTATQLITCLPFRIQIDGEEIGLKTTEDWLNLYRKFIAIPEHERNGTGPTSVNGIDVMQNFLPWPVFGLDPSTAAADDVKTAFRDLAKIHHPDMGGDARVFERLKKCGTPSSPSWVGGDKRSASTLATMTVDATWSVYPCYTTM